MLLKNIIAAYNKEYEVSLKEEDIEYLILDIPTVIINGKRVSWESIKLN